MNKLSQLSQLAGKEITGFATGNDDCREEANEARLSLFKSAGKEIAKILCSGLYTTTDPTTGKNLKEVMMDRISDVVFEVANTPDTVRTIRKAITVPLEKYSKQLFEVASADANRVNSFTANVLQNLFHIADPLLPKILKSVLEKLPQEDRDADTVMNAMSERILELLSEGNKSSLGTKLLNEGAKVFGFEIVNIQAVDRLEREFSDERTPVEPLVTPEQAQQACKKQPVKFTDVRSPPSATVQQQLCEVNQIIQQTGDDINTRIVDAIDKDYIQDVVEKAVRVFFKKFNKEFRVRLIDTMVNEQGKLFINQPVMKMQILYSVLTADEHDRTTKQMFITGQKIFRRALTTYLATLIESPGTPMSRTPISRTPNKYDPFMVILDQEFTAAIAVDSGNSITELPTQIVKAIQGLDQVPERKSISIRTKGGSKKSKKTRSKKNKSKKTRSKKNKSRK
jgi:hypothetical protein